MLQTFELLSFIFRLGNCYTYCPRQIVQGNRVQEFSMQEKTRQSWSLFVRQSLSSSMQMINSGRISVYLQERHSYHMTHEMTKNVTNIERNGCVCITHLNLKFTEFYVFLRSPLEH